MHINFCNSQLLILQYYLVLTRTIAISSKYKPIEYK